MQTWRNESTWDPVPAAQHCKITWSMKRERTHTVALTFGCRATEQKFCLFFLKKAKRKWEWRAAQYKMQQEGDTKEQRGMNAEQGKCTGKKALKHNIKYPQPSSWIINRWTTAVCWGMLMRKHPGISADMSKHLSSRRREPEPSSFCRL